MGRKNWVSTELGALQSRPHCLRQEEKHSLTGKNIKSKPNSTPKVGSSKEINLSGKQEAAPQQQDPEKDV